MNDWLCCPRTLGTDDVLKRENEGDGGEGFSTNWAKRWRKGKGAVGESRLITPSVPTAATACSVLPQYSAQDRETSNRTVSLCDTLGGRAEEKREIEDGERRED